MNRYVAVFLLIMGIVSSGVGLVYTKHQSRKLFIELQVLQMLRDDLEIDWEMLQLEESTLTTEAVVDQAARVRLNMIVPDANSVIYIKR